MYNNRLFNEVLVVGKRFFPLNYGNNQFISVDRRFLIVQKIDLEIINVSSCMCVIPEWQVLVVVDGMEVKNHPAICQNMTMFISGNRIGNHEISQ